MDESIIVALIVVVIIVFLALLASGIRIIRPWEQGIYTRLGTFIRVLNPGLHVVTPLVSTVVSLDLRTQVLDVPRQEVITKDNSPTNVDAIIYIKVIDPKKAQFEVTNYRAATVYLAQTTMRSVVGDMELDDILSSREKINVTLRDILDEATDKWGVRVVRVELQRIEPPADVTQAMHRQMKAERDRRAMILEAEGDKAAAIARAEGTKQSAILEAEGKANAIKEIAEAERQQKILMADGEAQGIKNVFGAIHDGGPTDDLLAIRYIDALRYIANGNATKIFMPLELQGMASAVGAIGEVFKSTQE